MVKNKKESFFWTSYSDLMTSLFFVMLVLFVLTVSLLQVEKNKAVAENEATQAQLDKINELNKSIETIDKEYFQYDQKYKRHTLRNIQVSFQERSADMNDINDEDRQRLLDAGKAIQSFMRNAKDSIPQANYLLIIEGQSSKDGYAHNFELSYERALSLFIYWKENNVTFDNLPCEVIISGSGYESPFRIIPEKVRINGKWKGNPENQRFVIHIIPKPGIIEDGTAN